MQFFCVFRVFFQFPPKVPMKWKKEMSKRLQGVKKSIREHR